MFSSPRLPSVWLCDLTRPPHATSYGFDLDRDVHTGGLYISAVLRNSPAAAAGLRIGDQVLTIHGIDVLKHTLQEVAALVYSHPQCLQILVLDPQGQQECRVRNIACCDIVSSLTHASTSQGQASANLLHNLPIKILSGSNRQGAVHGIPSTSASGPESLTVSVQELSSSRQHLVKTIGTSTAVQQNQSHIDDYLYQNIVASLCCCCLVGLLGVYKSWKCRRAKDELEYNQARRYSDEAGKLLVISSVLGLLWLTALILIIIVAGG